MRLFTLTTGQLLCCLLIAAAGLVPVFHKNKPVWGLYGISWGNAPPKIQGIDSNSPAGAAGLQVGDEVLSADGVAMDLSALHERLEGLAPGQTATLRVKRGDAERNVTVTAVEPPLAKVYYQTAAHPVVGAVGLALALLVFVTQPVRPAPRWRAALLCVAGFALAVTFSLLAFNDSPFTHLGLWSLHTLNWGARVGYFEQSWVGLAASLALTALAATELRGLLGAAAPPPVTPPAERPVVTAIRAE